MSTASCSIILNIVVKKEAMSITHLGNTGCSSYDVFLAKSIQQELCCCRSSARSQLPPLQRMPQSSTLLRRPIDQTH